MTCEIERPDPQLLFDRYQRLFSTTVLGGAEIIPESNEFYAAALNYAMAEEFYAISEQQWKERNPETACCDNLYKLAARDGVFPFPAIASQGYVKLTGEPGTLLPSPLEFLIGDLTFVTAINANQPTQISDDGTAVIRVRAVSPGAAGNVTVATGQLVTIVDGVDNTIEVCGGSFCQGSDAENCEVFRQRYLRRLQYQPRATQAWILEKFLEWPCVTRALPRGGSCCECGEPGNDCADCDCNECGGRTDFYVMFDSSFPCGIAPQSVIDEIQEWMFGSPQGYGNGLVPIGVCGRIVVPTPVAVNVAVDIASCPTSSTLQKIKDQITEYFQTLSPSEPLLTSVLQTIVLNLVGADVNIDVVPSTVDPAQSYGAGFGPRTDQSAVFVGGCDFEPDCDFLLCLNEISFTTGGLTEINCP